MTQKFTHDTFFPLQGGSKKVSCCTVSTAYFFEPPCTVWSRKIALSFMHRHFATVYSRITSFSPKCSEKITVYLSIQNLCQLVKYSLINNQSWIHVMSDVTLHVNITPLTVEDGLLI